MSDRESLTAKSGKPGGSKGKSASDAEGFKDKTIRKSVSFFKTYVLPALVLGLLIGGLLLRAHFMDKHHHGERKRRHRVVHDEPGGDLIHCKHGHKYWIEKIYYRQPDCYTQGFHYLGNGMVLESCGMYDKSRVVLAKLEDNPKDLLKSKYTVVKTTTIEGESFGEGIEVFKDKDKNEYYYQLTWMEQHMNVFNKDLRMVAKVPLPPPQFREGWGLARYPGRQDMAFLTDGTNEIKAIQIPFPESPKPPEGNDPVPKLHQAKILRKYEVYSSGTPKKPQNLLNELAFSTIEGDSLYANIYLNKEVGLISMNTGRLITKIDFSHLVHITEKYYESVWKQPLTNDKCLNGISTIYPPETIRNIDGVHDMNHDEEDFRHMTLGEDEDRLLITGKDWPMVFQIRLKLNIKK